MILGANHVAINVTDMEKCIPFYRDILKLKQTHDFMMDGEFLDTVQAKSDMNYRIVKFESGDGFMIELLQDFGHTVEPQKQNTLQDAGLRHFAYEVDDVDAHYKYLKDAGCETVSEPCTSDDGSMRLFFVRDPELNLIEIMQFYNK